MDLDDLLGYQAPRMIKIRDRRLGCLNLFFFAGLAFYIFLYLLLYQHGYVLTAPPSGTYSLKVQAPLMRTMAESPTTPCCLTEECATNLNVMPVVPAVSSACTGPPCDSSSMKGCYRAFAPMTDLVYCTQSGEGERTTRRGQTAKNLNCTYWDGADALVHVGADYLLTTHAILHDQAHVNTAEVKQLQDEIATEQATSGAMFVGGASTRRRTSAKPSDFGNIASEDYSWHPEGEGATSAAGAEGGGGGEEIADEAVPDLLNFANGTRRTCGCSDKTDLSSCFDSRYDPKGSYSCPLIWHTYTTEDVFIADVENFTLTISHYIEQLELGIKKGRSEMAGWLSVDLDKDDPSKQELQHQLCKKASDIALEEARAAGE
jgi:hypothetical protein